MSAPGENAAGGCTTLARLWKITRRDGRVFGFTDHDRDLEVEGCRYEAASGLTARVLSRTTGLAADNSEALGALRSAALTEADLRAGRYDGAAVEISLTDWQDPQRREVLFAGHLGEIARSGGAFRAELRGLADLLTRERGRIYQRSCTAVLGDKRCGLDLSQPGWRVELPLLAAEAGDRLVFAEPGFAPGWFERGQLRLLSGAGAGLSAVIRLDRRSGGQRVIALRDRIAAELQPGDLAELTAGCDRRAETCRGKFANFLNFRGFPHLPPEDWLMAVPGRRS